ncbi:hypothetical protein DFH28DRAFT_934404 [Melampsora americana]|nr:hypothetical protein DFH28DRAFT_934404 [Melampsora americana]
MSKAKFSQQRALYPAKLSSSEADIELPPKRKKKSYSSPQYPESSKDTPDLHEPSNFRTSPINTRLQGTICLAVNIDLESPENSDDQTSDPVFMPGMKRWKGKAICTGDSTEAKQIKKQVEVLSNMLNTYMNNTPSASKQGDRAVFRSTGEDTSNSKGSLLSPPELPGSETLYGLKRGEKLVPNGSISAGSKGWMVNISFHELLNKGNNNPASIEDPIPSTGDPCFPYPKGPGGESSSRRDLGQMTSTLGSMSIAFVNSVREGRVAYVMSQFSVRYDI